MTTPSDPALDATEASAPGTATPKHPTPEFAETAGETVAPTRPARTIDRFPMLDATRYVLGGEVGRGGLGRVLNAHDQVLDRDVAIKELHSDSDGTRARFVREALITARLQHPSIVPIYEAGRWSDGAPFYAMKLVAGRPFATVISEAKTLSQRLALIPVVLAVADALAYAHARRIVHRDLKPANVLVGEFGETVVIDWGLAKDLSIDDRDALDAGPYRASNQDQTLAGQLFGTPAYMAPEQARGEDTDERADVYALGAMLYQVVAGTAPHRGVTLDEMLEQIIAGKVAPIADLEPGIPQDLAALVGKAMNVDRTLRYPSAKALADDLRRFQTGQLVASYRYSRRELVMRFIRRHRGSVITATAALVVLVAIGSIAVTRIIDERDRTNAALASVTKQQQLAEDQRDKLILQTAKTQASTNPTAAIAMLKPLVAKHWQEARAIATAARATGVAWSMPASKRVVTLELSRDGQRALVAGDDGAVRIYDLAHHSARSIVERGPKVSARYADGERRIVVWAGAQLTVLDAATGAQLSALAVARPILDLAIVGVTAYWADEGHAVWQLDLASKRPTSINVPEGVIGVLPSPDGRWVALRGESHLLLHDRARPTELVEMIRGQTTNLDWSDDGEHLAALVDSYVLDIAMAPVPTLLQRSSSGVRQYVAYVEERVYVAGPAGVSSTADYVLATRKQLVGDPIGLAEGPGGAVIAGAAGGITVLTDDGDHTLILPSGRLAVVAASAHSPYVVGMIEGRLLVWNLSDVLPRRLVTPAPPFARLVGNDRFFTADEDGTAEWFDLASGGKPRALGEWLPVAELVAAPDGKSACAISVGHSARLFVEGHDPEDIAKDVDMAVFASPTQLMLGAVAGTIQLVDLGTKRHATLVTRGAKLVHLAVAHTTPWVAAAFADGTLWRQNLASGVTSTTTLPATPARLLVEANGVVVFPDGRAIRAWSTSGILETRATLPKPAVALAAAGASGRALAFSDDGTTYVIDANARVTESETVGVTKVAMSAESGVLVWSQQGSIEVFDSIANHRWTLATSPGISYVVPQISNDGSRVVSRRVASDRVSRIPTSLVTWRLTSPTTADGVATWLDTMTNAVVDTNGVGGIGWR